MSDRQMLVDRLTAVLEALQRIPRRFAGISAPSDFTDTEAGVTQMDAICMVLIAVGEQLKKLDNDTHGALLAQYPNVSWRGIIGVRDFLAHGYFQVNPEQLFAICRDDIPALIQTVRGMIADLD